MILLEPKADGDDPLGQASQRELLERECQRRVEGSQAPFHTVARLTLTPKSQLPAAACEAWHIDVTENSTPDTAPIGSINRARWHAEVASRKARLGQKQKRSSRKPRIEFLRA